MSLKLRIIPKIEIKGPNLIKGLQYDGFRALGKAMDFALAYYQEGADELIYQDVVASLYRRESLLELIECSAKNIFVPLTVMGGIRTLDDIYKLLKAGADKVGINTAATEDPELITNAANEFGSQCVMGSIEAYVHEDGSARIWTHYGKDTTKIDALSWAKELVERGAGELHVSAINRDGMGNGPAVELIQAINESVSVPVIAASGFGELEHFEWLKGSNISGVALSSMLHYHYALAACSDHIHSNAVDLIREHQDVGNDEFLLNGYGGERALCVSPRSLPELKAELSALGHQIRMGGQA